MASNSETVYIKADRNVEVTKPSVTLGDVLKMECANTEMIPKLKTIKLLTFHHTDKKNQNRTAVSVLRVIELIHEQYPNIDVQNMGEQDFIVTYEEQQTAGGALHIIKAAVVVLISFIGAAFSIMAFNNDVDVTKMFGQIYQLITGTESNGFTILELTYSIGLIIGILTFFNHFGKKRFSVDPTPMEVEMRLYENDLQTTLIENISRKGKELDVGKRNTSGSHRT
ncbi:MAG: stage V sporulation protein AA [Lachnospiraceae bacterium]